MTNLNISWKFEDFCYFKKFMGHEKVLYSLKYTIFLSQEIVRNDNAEKVGDFVIVSEDDSTETIRAHYTGSTRLNLYNFEKDFVPYENLTPEIIEEWVKKSIPYEEAISILKAQLYGSYEQTVVNEPPPWLK